MTTTKKSSYYFVLVVLCLWFLYFLKEEKRNEMRLQQILWHCATWVKYNCRMMLILDLGTCQKIISLKKEKKQYYRKWISFSFDSIIHAPFVFVLSAQAKAKINFLGLDEQIQIFFLWRTFLSQLAVEGYRQNVSKRNRHRLRVQLCLKTKTDKNKINRKWDFINTYTIYFWVLLSRKTCQVK